MKSYTEFLYENFSKHKLYRGSSSINPFDKSEGRNAGSHPSHWLGVFCTPDKKVAESYGSGGFVFTFLYNIKNAYKMTYNELVNIKNKTEAISIRRKLIRNGYDSIKLMPITDEPWPTEYVFFYPETQLKLIKKEEVNVNNKSK